MYSKKKKEKKCLIHYTRARGWPITLILALSKIQQCMPPPWHSNTELGIPYPHCRAKTTLFKPTVKRQRHHGQRDHGLQCGPMARHRFKCSLAATLHGKLRGAGVALNYHNANNKHALPVYIFYKLRKMN